MNNKKIAFILCVNDITEFQECSYYLERLQVPEGYEAEIITVLDATSMAAGYNEAMHSSDAKYKIYMHQDVFVRNVNFLEDMLAVFHSSEKIGMMGMIGRKRLSEHLLMALDWDTGRILHNCAEAVMDYADGMEDVQPVEAVDGLLIATCLDIEWREDLFDGWDFYDISQCMEFLRAGYQVVVPKQTDIWCYHDNSYSKLKKYFAYQAQFVEEYKDIRAFHSPGADEKALEIEALLESLKGNLSEQIEQGKKDEVAEVFRQLGNTSYLALRELAAISQIDRLERANDVTDLFWEDGMSTEALLEKLRILKYRIKRLEFHTQPTGEIMADISGNYSVFAVATVVNFYVGYKDDVVAEVASFYERNNMEWEATVWAQIKTQFSAGI